MDKVHVHGHADLDNVDGVPRFAKLLDGTNDDVRLNARKFRAFFVHIVVVADELQKKGNVRRATFLANTLYPREFLRINCVGAERRIVEKDFDGLRSEVAKFCGGESFQQTRKAPGNGFVVSGLLVCEEKSRLRSARSGGGKSEFRIEENGAGMRRKHAADARFEIDEKFERNLFRNVAGGFCEKLAKGAALIDGERGDDAAIGGERFEAALFTRR